MPRFLHVGPLSVLQSSDRPADAVGAVGAALNTVSDAVMKPADYWAAADVAARALATPSAMALRAARDIAAIV